MSTPTNSSTTVPELNYTAISDFVNGKPTCQNITPANSSIWRCGENRTVSSLLSSPSLRSFIGTEDGTRPNKSTAWRCGDHGTINLGSPKMQDARKSPSAMNANNTSKKFTGVESWRELTAPLGSPVLEELVENYKTRVRKNPRTMNIISKRIATEQSTLNKTVAVIGSPQLQRRITIQRTTPPSPVFLKKSLSSPILPLGSIEFQHRARDILFDHERSRDDIRHYSVSQKFSEGFVASRHESELTNKMTWNDRHYLKEGNSMDYNYYPPRNISGRIKGRPEWIAGKQIRPPPKVERESLEWSANATRRANSNNNPKNNGDGSPSRERGEWRYKKRYFFHKAGKSMLRQAYL